MEEEDEGIDDDYFQKVRSGNACAYVQQNPLKTNSLIVKFL